MVLPSLEITCLSPALSSPPLPGSLSSSCSPTSSKGSLLTQAIVAEDSHVSVTSVENSIPVTVVTGETSEGPLVQSANLSKIIQRLLLVPTHSYGSMHNS